MLWPEGFNRAALRTSGHEKETVPRADQSGCPARSVVLHAFEASPALAPLVGVLYHALCVAFIGAHFNRFNWREMMNLNIEDYTVRDWLEIITCAVCSGALLWLFVGLVFVLGGPH